MMLGDLLLVDLVQEGVGDAVRAASKAEVCSVA